MNCLFCNSHLDRPVMCENHKCSVYYFDEKLYTFTIKHNDGNQYRFRFNFDDGYFAIFKANFNFIGNRILYSRIYFTNEIPKISPDQSIEFLNRILNLGPFL